MATATEHRTDADYATSHTVYLPPKVLQPAPWNPRRDFDATALAELAASLKRHGMLQPIVARLVDGPDPHYQVLAGERRLRAANIAGLRTVPVNVVEADDRRAREITVIENAKRQDLNPIEAAEAFKLLLDEGMKQTELAAAVKVTQPTIAKTVGLLSLPEPVQDLIRAGKLTASHGEALLNLKAFPEACTVIAEWGAEHGASVRHLAKSEHLPFETLVQKKLAISIWTAPFKDTTCKHCPYQAFRSVDSYHTYCLKPEHFHELEETHKAARQQQLEAEVAAAKAKATAPEVLQLASLQRGQDFTDIYTAPPGCTDACPCRAEGTYNPQHGSRPICRNPARFHELELAEAQRKKAAEQRQIERRRTQLDSLLEAIARGQDTRHVLAVVIAYELRHSRIEVVREVMRQFAPHIKVKKGKEFAVLDDLARLVPQQLIGIAVAVRIRTELASKAEYGYSSTEWTDALLGPLPPEDEISLGGIATPAEGVGDGR